MKNFITSVIALGSLWLCEAWLHKINVSVPEGTSKTEFALSLWAVLIVPWIILLIGWALLKNYWEKEIAKHMHWTWKTGVGMIKFYLKTGNFLMSVWSLGLVSGVFAIIGNL
jgi:hypothetical protein